MHWRCSTVDPLRMSLRRSVLANKCWVAGCAFNVKRPRLAILARCLMPMNVQSWSVCAAKMPNYVWTVSF